MLGKFQCENFEKPSKQQHPRNLLSSILFSYYFSYKAWIFNNICPSLLLITKAFSFSEWILWDCYIRSDNGFRLTIFSLSEMWTMYEKFQYKRNIYKIFPVIFNISGDMLHVWRKMAFLIIFDFKWIESGRELVLFSIN